MKKPLLYSLLLVLFFVLGLASLFFVQNRITSKKSQSVSLRNGQSYTLELSAVTKSIEGKKLQLLAYNRMIPGPTLVVTQNSEVEIKVKNKLSFDTTLHPHGLRVENRFDGTPHLTQKAIKPGETFSYKLRFPDPGVYWYHPHVREDITQELGLYGSIIVQPSDPDYWSPVNQEVPLFVDDVSLESAPRSDAGGAVTHALMGRFGTTMLTNGETNFTRSFNRGDVVRFYFTNAASSRVFNMSIPGARLKEVGGDNGRIQQEQFVDSLLISPAERRIVEVLFAEPGEYVLEHNTPQKTYRLGTFRVHERLSRLDVTKEFETLRTDTSLTQLARELASDIDKEPDKVLRLLPTMMDGSAAGSGSATESAHAHLHHIPAGTSLSSDQIAKLVQPEPIEWEDTMGTANADMTADMVRWKLVDPETKQENMDVHWQFKQGERVKLKIVNEASSVHPMHHPIHVHGQRFLVTSINGLKQSNVMWKDTVLVPTGDTAEILIDMDNPGDWTIHCHIPEHMESGMMTAFSVR